MRIGDLAEATGVAPRLLRYYEEQGLLAPQRGENGYRVYDVRSVESVRQIRSLLNAGLGTDTIRDVLPCSRPDGTLEMCPRVRATLETELVEIEARLQALHEHHGAIARHLAAGVEPAHPQAI